MKKQGAPDPAVRRLSLYLRALVQLAAKGVEQVSSLRLAERLELTSAQVRKDLGYFGQFGRPGVGYRVNSLIERLRHILGTDKTWNVIVVGVGNLGSALLQYKDFLRRGFEIVAGFDVSATKVGRQVGGILVRHMDELPAVARKYHVKLAIVAVPAEFAQDVVEQLSRAGVKGILNFAPTILHSPTGVTVGWVDIAAHLEQLSFRVAGRHT